MSNLGRDPINRWYARSLLRFTIAVTLAVFIPTLMVAATDPVAVDCGEAKNCKPSDACEPASVRCKLGLLAEAVSAPAPKTGFGKTLANDEFVLHR